MNNSAQISASKIRTSTLSHCFLYVMLLGFYSRVANEYYFLGFHRLENDSTDFACVILCTLNEYLHAEWRLLAYSMPDDSKIPVVVSPQPLCRMFVCGLLRVVRWLSVLSFCFQLMLHSLLFATITISHTMAITCTIIMLPVIN